MMAANEIVGRQLRTDGRAIGIAPTMDVIVWQQPDGSLAIASPVEPIAPGETVDAYLDRARAQAEKNPDFAGFVHLGNVNGADVPQDDYFEAFRWDGKAVVIDLDHAREIHCQRLLAQRDALMQTVLVAAFLGEPGAKEKLQRLRDMEAALEAAAASAATVEELKQVTHPDLA
jgi:hypothetical protein